MSTFLKTEYEARLKAAMRAMETAGIDVLLVSDPANMNYLSGYDGFSFYVHQTVVVLAGEQQPVWIGRELDANGARFTTWMDDEHVIPYPESYIQAESVHPMDFVADFLRAKGRYTARIGVEKDAYYFSAMSLERLQRGLPDVTFEDATLLVNRIRLMKSDAEISLMRKAAAIVENVMDVAIRAVEPGVRGCDAAAQVYHAQIRGTEDFGGDYPAIIPLMPSGERRSCTHLSWTEERYKEGDAVILELAACHQRYHVPLTRTLILGEPAVQTKELSDVVIEGLESALETVKPGTTCEEVEAAWRRVIESAGYSKESRLGYPVGLGYPPDWGEHTASIRKGDQTILMPNMTFHLIGGMWQEDYGVAFSETFRVTDTGCEVLSRVPRVLSVKY